MTIYLNDYSKSKAYQLISFPKKCIYYVYFGQQVLVYGSSKITKWFIFSNKEHYF